MSGIQPPNRPREVAGLIAAAFLIRDLPTVSADERTAAALEVDMRVQAMPDLMRLGVRVAGAVSYVVLSLVAHRPFRRVPEARRADLVARLARVSLPLVSEYIRLTRGLGLAAVVEARTPPFGDGA